MLTIIFLKIIYDELGLPKAIALLGKDLDGDGKAELDIADNLAGIPEITETEQADIQSFFNTENANTLSATARTLLHNATSRFVYDFDSYHSSANFDKPVVVASIVREQHNDPGSKLQMGFEYTDGAGKPVMKKIQANQGKAKQIAIKPDGSFTVNDINTADAGSTLLRWIGNGRTVFNNKGNPVKQYEPYFSVTPFYENAKELVETGVTPILYYDSLGRNIQTIFPDETFRSVKFDAWKKLTYDQNDNVQDSLWYIKRMSNPFDAGLTAEGKGPVKEKDAATKSIKHNDTPAQLHIDTLERPIFSLEDNGKDDKNKDLFYTTYIELDIEGNARKITDARGNAVMRYRYDMLGHPVYQNSMDAGERWMLNSVMGNPVLKWDSRDHIFSFTYDALHRPSEMKVDGGEDPANSLNNVYEKINYGESDPAGKKNNLRGKPIEHFDTAGKVSFKRYDLQGNLLESSRQLVDTDYKKVPQWSGAAMTTLEVTQYPTIQKYDALNRITETITADGSSSSFAYHESNLLNKVTVVQNGNSTLFVSSIDYNEKGQRKNIKYKNNVTTDYTYDKNTFRLNHLETKTGTGKEIQNLDYTYDPVGNITLQVDNCIHAQFYKNYLVDGMSGYEYDPLYRLIQADGREHAGQLVFTDNDNSGDFSFMMNPRPHPGDKLAWQSYTQNYLYDPVGNINEMSHVANGKGWTRIYHYKNDSNRLDNTIIDGNATIYKYPHHPNHGFITGMPHLSKMEWNFKDELQATAQQQVNGGNAPTTYYVYDAQGQRVRKIMENSAGKKINERIYLGSAELYFEYDGGVVSLNRDTLHVMDDKQRIAMIDTLKIENGKKINEILVRYQFSNHLGSVSLELNDEDDPKIISYEEYHPYGTTSYQAINADIKSAAKRYRYTGMERDEETGFGYHSARYYIPWLGRWLSCDKSPAKTLQNKFVFVNNRAFNYVDNSGNEEVHPNFLPTSLGESETAKQISDKIKALAQLPSSTTNDELVSRLFEVGNVELEKRGIPKVSVHFQSYEEMKPGTGAGFDEEKWKIEVQRRNLPSSESTNGPAISTEKLAALSSTIFHEFEHVRQTYLGIRYLQSTQELTSSQTKALLGIKDSSGGTDDIDRIISNAASKPKLISGTQEFTLAKEAYELIKTEQAAKSNAGLMSERQKIYDVYAGLSLEFGRLQDLFNSGKILNPDLQTFRELSLQELRSTYWQYRNVLKQAETLRDRYLRILPREGAAEQVGETIQTEVLKKNH